jgi:hypothetical protein
MRDSFEFLWCSGWVGFGLGYVDGSGDGEWITREATNYCTGCSVRDHLVPLKK